MAEREVVGKAPGRVNLIGDHTDYNEGYVLPLAIPQQTWVTLTPREDRHVVAHSTAMEPAGFVVGEERRQDSWVDYLAGAVWALRQEGHAVTGFEARVHSEVPVGSGLSSSAALLVAFLRGARTLWTLPIDDDAIVKLAHRAETEFVGVPVGLLDPLACSFADERNALFIDLRTMRSSRVALPPGMGLLVIDSGERHDHGSGPYRTRRSECEQAARALGVPWLRDVGLDDLPRIEALPDPLSRRARHVVTENVRVLEAVAALDAKDAARFGQLCDASHASMRDDFECSTPGIDVLVRAIRALPGVHGVRLTGGGFGGSVIAVAEGARVLALAEAIGTLDLRGARISPRVLVRIALN
jgi:galactokinase